MGDEARWLDRDGLARYLSIRAESISRLVRQGRLPGPSYRLGNRQPRWDRLALDADMSGGIASTDFETSVKAWIDGDRETLGPRRQAQARGRHD